MRIFIKILLLFIVFSQYTAAQQPAAAAVASAHPLATSAGIEVLKQGGNAFDAAVAITAALAVVEPYASGLGGGGFWLIHRAEDGKQVMIDGRETAPYLAHRRMYQDDEGNVRKGVSLNGPMAAAIPGIPAGIVHLAQHYGVLPLKTTLAPAIRYARKGFQITSRYEILVGYRLQVMRKYPQTASIFLSDNNVPEIGTRIKQKNLAKTLELIADKGVSGFYSGKLAEQMVTVVNQHGGIWSLKDLSGYKVVEREPIVINYRDIKIISAPPPSSGGIVLGQALKILEKFNLNSLGSVSRKHHIIEAMRRAYRDRAVYLGDPDFMKVPVARLLDNDYLEGITLSISPETATPSSMLGDSPGLDQTGMQTTHFSVIDTHGNRVAGTLSINLPFGSGFVAGNTGVLLNNEMDDFSIKRFTPNAYGLVGDEANAIAPGKRPLSSMTPTFLQTDDRVAILGTPGGSRIISMVLLATLDFADGNLPDSWVSLPRYHHQYLPDIVLFERDGLSFSEQRALHDMGHNLKEHNRRYGNMHAILWNKKINKVYAASDPRGEGSATVTELIK